MASGIVRSGLHKKRTWHLSEDPEKFSLGSQGFSCTPGVVTSFVLFKSPFLDKKEAKFILKTVSPTGIKATSTAL